MRAEKKDPKMAALDAASIGIAVASGALSPAQGAKELLGLSVDMIPVEYLKEFLTERDRIWADLAADVAEQIKLEKLNK